MLSLGRDGRSTTLRPHAPGWPDKMAAPAGSASSVSAWAGDLPSCSPPATGSRRRASTMGTVPKDADRLLAGACPVVGSFGAKDWSLRGAAGRLERVLSGAGWATT